MSLVGKRGKYLAARLKHRVTIQEPIHISDTAGGAAVTWSDVATIWADISSRRSGGETLFGGKLQAEMTHIIAIRYRSDVTAKMRISYDGRLFNIRRIDNVDAENVLLEILVEEGVEL